MRRMQCLVLTAILTATTVPGLAKMKVMPPKKKSPLPTATPVPQPKPTARSGKRSPARSIMAASMPVREKVAPSQGPVLVGSVVYAKGPQSVAEIRGGVVDGETLNVLGPDFRKKGKARVVKALANETYLLGGVGLGVGDHLSRETEVEAAARVLAANDLEDYRAFLARFPRSAYRPRVGREMFRIQMKAQYPSYPGSEVRGRLALAEPVSRPVSLGGVRIVLDRYVIAVTAESGEFRIEGLPKLEESVELGIRVKDARFRMVGETFVDLLVGKPGEWTVEVPLLLTPTVLRGRVLDGDGAPVAGAEVWTTPYSMEVLTDGEGGFSISRRKLSGGSTAGATDEPLFGGEYRVFASRRGFDVGVSELTARSHDENAVEPIRLAAWDVRREALPPLVVNLASHLMVSSVGLAAPLGGGPLLNP